MAVQEEFTVTVTLKTGTGRSGVRTLFNDDWRYFTVPAKVHRDWRDQEGEGRYRFQVSAGLKRAYAGTELAEILEAMEDPRISPALTVSHNEGENTDRRTMWELTDGGFRYANYRCQFSRLLHAQLRLLLISTLVYNAQGLKLDPPESFTLRFRPLDRDKTAQLTAVSLYRPEDPYLAFARRAAARTSFQHVFQQPEQPGRVRNFYESFTPWLPAGSLDAMKEDVEDVIYMLYDAGGNRLYVGRADKLVKRLNDHRNRINPNEPIPDFTHFRYSKISPEYSDFSYLLENAAIHDCAWLFGMPASQRYRGSLQDLLRHTGGDLSGVTLVNGVDQQTRMRNRKKS